MIASAAWAPNLLTLDCRYLPSINISIPKIMLLNNATIGSKTNKPTKITNNMDRSAISIVEVAKTFMVSASVPLVSK
jgi:hypothetical protein